MSSRASSVISSYSAHSEASESPAPSLSRTRRWASTSALGEDDQEEEGQPQSKRRAAGGRRGVAAGTSKGAASAVPFKATPVEKEQRKEARMVRNRSTSLLSSSRSREVDPNSSSLLS